jgi:hypothetical protein
VTLQNPFEHFARDSDIEGLSDGFDERTAYGARARFVCEGSKEADCTRRRAAADARMLRV